MSPTLNEIEPREQLGVVSGRAYDFQYETAAAACLQLLEDAGPTCVFCEWHDDYVLELDGPTCTLYGFHQVKTKSEGSWTLGEVFGLKRQSKKEKPANKEAAVVRLLLHFGNFPQGCDRIVLVTNATFGTDVTTFLDGVQAAQQHTALDEDSAHWFSRIIAAYTPLFKDLTPDLLFSFLKRLDLEAEAGSLDSPQMNRIALAWRLHDLSEIDLRTTEAQRIARDLVELVRTKSHRTLPLPVSEQVLRQDKGVVVDDILRILSLSPDGFRALKQQGPGAAKSLSRLSRLCESNNVPPSAVPHLCVLKCEWDVWWRANRHALSSTDFVMLQNECDVHLDLWSEGKATLEQLGSACGDLAAKYASLSPSAVLTKDLVFGLVLALAAGRGA